MFRLDPETVWYFDHDYVWMVLGPAQAPVKPRARSDAAGLELLHQDIQDPLRAQKGCLIISPARPRDGVIS